MGNTIADYPPATLPLDGSEAVPAWQDGKQVYIPASRFSAAITDTILNDAGFLAIKSDVLLAGSSKIFAAGADLLLGASSKMAICAADLSLGSSSTIAQAPYYANLAQVAASVAVSTTLQDTASTGRPIGTDPVAGTGAAAAGVYIIKDTATIARTYYQVRCFNNSGSNKTLNLYRGVLTAGNWVRTGTAVTLTIPSGGTVQTVSIPGGLVVNVGERLYADQPVAGAFNYSNATTGDNGGYLNAATGTTSVADGAGITNIRLEFAADYTFAYVTTAKVKNVEAAQATTSASVSDAVAAYQGVATTGAFWRPKSATLVTGTPIGAFGLVSNTVIPRRRVARTVNVFKSNAAAATITLFRAAINTGTRAVTPVDSTTALVSVPSGTGYFSIAIPNGFTFQAGDREGMLVTANAFDYISATGDELGYYGLANATTTNFGGTPAAALQTAVQLQISIAYDEVSDLQAPVIHVNMATADRGYWFGDSYGSGQFNIKNHAAITRLSRQTPWQIMSFALGGSTIRRDDGIAISRITDFRNNVARFGTYGPQNIAFKIGLVELGRNDATLGNTPQQTLEDYRELDQIIAGAGGRPVVMGSHSDHYGNDQLPMYKRMAESQRRDFIDVGMWARRFGQNKGISYTDNHWKAGHPGMRVQFFDQAVLDYLEGIGNPMISLKVFRPRNTAASIASLYYGESHRDYARNLLWQEVATGHAALSSGAEKFWDDLSNAGAVYSDVPCEYTTLYQGGTLSFMDYGLVEFTVDRLQQHTSNMVFKMLDAGCTIVLPDMTSATPANGTAPGSTPAGQFGTAISPTVANGVASYSIPDTVKKKAQRFDKIIIGIVKTGGGAFSLGGIDLSYWGFGPQKPILARQSVVPRGAEQMPSISFPTSGAPSSPWTVVSGSPTCGALDPNDSPVGATGILSMAVGDSVSQPITWTAPSYGDKEFEVWVYARLKVAAFSSASSYPGSSPATDTTLNQTQISVSLYQSSGSNAAAERKTIGMGWTLVPIRGLAQIGTTGQTVVIAPTTDPIEVCVVRSAFVDG